MDRATKPVLDVWFDMYKKVIEDLGITQENIYNIDKSRFLIGTIEST